MIIIHFLFLIQTFSKYEKSTFSLTFTVGIFMKEIVHSKWFLLLFSLTNLLVCYSDCKFSEFQVDSSRNRLSFEAFFFLK